MPILGLLPHQKLIVAWSTRGFRIKGLQRMIVVWRALDHLQQRAKIVDPYRGRQLFT
jgi:hypothetical protein